jgi:hypothetical protein
MKFCIQLGRLSYRDIADSSCERNGSHFLKWLPLVRLIVGPGRRVDLRSIFVIPSVHHFNYIMSNNNYLGGGGDSNSISAKSTRAVHCRTACSVPCSPSCSHTVSVPYKLVWLRVELSSTPPSLLQPSCSTPIHLVMESLELVSQATPSLERRVWYFAMERFVLDQAQHVTHGAMIINSTQCTAVNQHSPIIVGNQNKPCYCKVPDPPFQEGCGLRDYSGVAIIPYAQE